MPWYTPIISLNKSVKLRFREGEELIIRIVEQKPRISFTGERQELLVQSKAPLAQAILGHCLGEEIEFKVGENKQQVTILGIN